MTASRPISYRPSAGLSYDPAEPRYWDPAALGIETERTFEVCHGCRLCFKYCDAFPTLFSLLDERHDGDVRRVTGAERDRIADTCFQCKLCEVECPYSRRDGHEFQLDVPSLVQRHRAVRARRKRRRLRDRVLGDPDLLARLARASFGMANLANRIRPWRWVLEKACGIHRAKLLPSFAPRTFEQWARAAGRIAREPGGEVALFQTCYVQNNEPSIGWDAVEVFERNGIDLRCVAGLGCCGMPAWEQGDLDGLRARARANLRRLLPFVEGGAKVAVLSPTCSMVMRRDYPELLAPEDREAAARLAAAVVGPSEFLWSIRDQGRFSTDFRSAPAGRVVYHVPCHLRVQAVGFRGRDLLRRIPGVKPAVVMECSGHDGTYAMSVEGFEPSRRIGRKAFDAMRAAGGETWVTDCPLAALQFRQHAGVKALHPMSVLARAYREDGFPRRLVSG